MLNGKGTCCCEDHGCREPAVLVDWLLICLKPSPHLTAACIAPKCSHQIGKRCFMIGKIMISPVLPGNYKKVFLRNVTIALNTELTEQAALDVLAAPSVSCAHVCTKRRLLLMMATTGVVLSD